MSVTLISTTTPPPVALEDYKHPEWCDLSHCQPSPHGPASEGGCHYSTPVIWGIQTEEARFSVQLVRGDDISHGTNHATTRLRIALRQWAWEDGDGFTEAETDAADARILASMLTRYADLADVANGVSARASLEFDAKDLPRR